VIAGPFALDPRSPIARDATALPRRAGAHQGLDPAVTQTTATPYETKRAT
jgi:hypothetical protein